MNPQCIQKPIMTQPPRQLDPETGLPVVNGAEVFFARERVPLFADALCVVLSQSPLAWGLMPPMFSDDAFYRMARELGHEGRVLLAEISQRHLGWCECGDPLTSMSDKLTGRCQYCRWDDAEGRVDSEDGE